MTPYFIIDSRPIVGQLQEAVRCSLSNNAREYAVTYHPESDHIESLFWIYMFRMFFTDHYYIDVIDFQRNNFFDCVYNDVKSSLETVMFQTLPYMDFIRVAHTGLFHVLYTGRNLFILAHQDHEVL